MLRREHVDKMLAEIEGRSARRSWFKAIRPLLQHAVPTMLREDPTAGIPTPKLPKTKGHHSWTDAEIAQYRAPLAVGTQQRLVFEFALRRSGGAKSCGSARSMSTPGRMASRHPHRPHPRLKDVDIPVAPELMAAIDAMPKAHRPSSSPPTASRAPSSDSEPISPNGRGGRFTRSLPAARAQKAGMNQARRRRQDDARTDGGLRPQDACRGRALHPRGQ